MNPLTEVCENVRADRVEVGDRLTVDGKRASVVEVNLIAAAEGDLSFVEVELRFDTGDRIEWAVVMPDERFTRIYNEHGQEVAA